MIGNKMAHGPNKGAKGVKAKAPANIFAESKDSDKEGAHIETGGDIVGRTTGVKAVTHCLLLTLSAGWDALLCLLLSHPKRGPLVVEVPLPL